MRRLIFPLLFAIFVLTRETDARVAAAASSLTPILDARLDEGNDGAVLVTVHRPQLAIPESSSSSSSPSPATVTGYKIYYTLREDVADEDYRTWRETDILSGESVYVHRLSRAELKTRGGISGTVRIRASVLLNSVESAPSPVIRLTTTPTVPPPPEIVDLKVVEDEDALKIRVKPLNTTPVHQFLIEWRPIEVFQGKVGKWSETGAFVSPQSDGDFELVLQNVSALASSSKILGIRVLVQSKLARGLPTEEKRVVVDLTVNYYAPRVTVSPPYQRSDPTSEIGFSIDCLVDANPSAAPKWILNGEEVANDTEYRIESSEVNGVWRANLRTATRTLAANYTCEAENLLGKVTSAAEVVIKGPGSPPSNITLEAEPKRYTLNWNEPQKPNGQILKYVVYYTWDESESLSDWSRLELSGDEHRLRLLVTHAPRLFVRLQAATALGPGPISDAVSAAPVHGVDMTVGVDVEGAVLLAGRNVRVHPAQLVQYRCNATGAQSTARAISTASRPEAIEPHEWLGEDVIARDAWTVWIANVWTANRSIADDNDDETSLHHHIHCRAVNTTDIVYATVELLVVQDDGPSLAPIKVEAELLADGLHVNWSAPPLPVGLTAWEYYVHITDNEQAPLDEWSAHVARAPPLLIDDSHVRDGSLFAVRVSARLSDGRTTLSKTNHFFGDYVSADAPRSLRSQITPANTVELTWLKPAGAHSTSIAAYVLYFTMDLSSHTSDYRTWKNVTLPSVAELQMQRTFFDAHLGLRPHMPVRARLAAILTSGGTTSASATVQFETMMPEIAVPSDVQITALPDGSAQFSFRGVRDANDRLVENYALELSEDYDGGEESQWQLEDEATWGSSTLHLDGRLEARLPSGRLRPTTQYWVRLRALLPPSSISGLPSAAIRFVTPEPEGGEPRLWIVEGQRIERSATSSAPFELTCHESGGKTARLGWWWKDADATLSGFRVATSKLDGSARTVHTAKLLALPTAVVETAEAGCWAEIDDGTPDGKRIQVEIRVVVHGSPTPPTQVQVAPYRNQFNLSWTPPARPNGRVQAYTIHYHTLPLTAETVRGNVTIDSQLGRPADATVYAVVPVLAPNALHAFRIQPLNDDARYPGVMSLERKSSSGPFYAPLSVQIEVQGLEVGAGPDGSTIIDPNHPIQFRCIAEGRPLPELAYVWGEYEVYTAAVVRDEAQSRVTVGGEVSSQQNRTLECRAVNLYERVVERLDFSILVPGSPPVDLRVLDAATYSVAWRPPQIPNGPIKKYMLELRQGSASLWTVEVIGLESGPLSMKTKVKASFPARLRVTAYTDYGHGLFSDWLDLMPPIPGADYTPLDLNISVNNVSQSLPKVDVIWRVRDGLGQPIESIILYLTSNDSVRDDDLPLWRRLQLLGSKRRFTLGAHTPLQPSTCYRLRIAVRTPVHEGPPTRVYPFCTPAWNSTFGDESRQDITPPPRRAAVAVANSTLYVRMPHAQLAKDYEVSVCAEDDTNACQHIQLLNLSRGETLRIDQLNIDATKRYNIRIKAVGEGDVELIRKEDINELTDALFVDESDEHEQELLDSQESRTLVKEPPL